MCNDRDLKKCVHNCTRHEGGHPLNKLTGAGLKPFQELRIHIINIKRFNILTPVNE